MLTERTLISKGAAKTGILRLFKAAGHTMSYHTLNKRLRDQKWFYIHGLILYKAGLWIEPDVIVTSAMVRDSLRKTPGAKYLDGTDPMPCLLYTSPSPRDGLLSRMPSSA